MTDRKIDAMHKEFGVADGKKCGECPWLHLYRGYGKAWWKCSAYGNSNSEATDWRKKWPACGLIDKSINGLVPMVKRLKHFPKSEPEQPIEGQIRMEELL